MRNPIAHCEIQIAQLRAEIERRKAVANNYDEHQRRRRVMPQARYVAIVDDDDAVRESLSTLLRAYGLDTQTYASGPDFLKALPFGVPSFLITDVNMPEMTGPELQGELARRGLRIPTVVITGYDDKNLRDKSRALGAVAYFQKPVDCDTLIATINPYLEPK